MQKLYTNGTIVTMKENELYSEALLIRDGSIQAVGTRRIWSLYARQIVSESICREHA